VARQLLLAMRDRIRLTPCTLRSPVTSGAPVTTAQTLTTGDTGTIDDNGGALSLTVMNWLRDW
jgi:hypothetical protein